LQEPFGQRQTCVTANVEDRSERADEGTQVVEVAGVLDPGPAFAHLAFERLALFLGGLAIMAAIRPCDQTAGAALTAGSSTTLINSPSTVEPTFM